MPGDADTPGIDVLQMYTSATSGTAACKAFSSGLACISARPEDSGQEWSG